MLRSRRECTMRISKFLIRKFDIIWWWRLPEHEKEVYHLILFELWPIGIQRTGFELSEIVHMEIVHMEDDEVEFRHYLRTLVNRFLILYQEQEYIRVGNQFLPEGKMMFWRYSLSQQGKEFLQFHLGSPIYKKRGTQ